MSHSALSHVFPLDTMPAGIDVYITLVWGDLKHTALNLS